VAGNEEQAEEPMTRSLYARLHAKAAPQSGCQLLRPESPQRRRLYEQHLLPTSDWINEVLAACPQLPSLRVAVVGAGFAGLTAAWFLRLFGINPTVFEASDRLGGRVWTDRGFVSGKVVEAGAELIGSNHPMWIELAQHFGLTLVPITQNYDQLWVRVRLGDYVLTDDDLKRVDAELQPVFDAIAQDAQGVDGFEPWDAPNAAVWDSMSVADRFSQLFPGDYSMARAVLEFSISNTNCAPLSWQSYLGLLALVSAGRMEDDPGLRGYWECTETQRCGGGNDQLAAYLAGQLGGIRLSAPVSRISITADDVRVAWGAGTVDTFDCVVLAASPPCWPPVDAPEGWDPNGYTMSHGPSVKFLSAYPMECWLDQGLAPSATWDQLGAVWENTDNQNRFQPGYGLSVFSGGPYIRDQDGYVAGLAALYPGCQASWVWYVDWPRMPWTQTGYSVPSPRQVISIGPGLNAPFGGRLYFAGEQTCLGFFGYMEGALQSGARAARDIVLEQCPSGEDPGPIATSERPPVGA
jgi:monoamine oxidase